MAEACRDASKENPFGHKERSRTIFERLEQQQMPHMRTCMSASSAWNAGELMRVVSLMAAFDATSECSIPE